LKASKNKVGEKENERKYRSGAGFLRGDTKKGKRRKA
jgi:hypothetical protein